MSGLNRRQRTYCRARAQGENIAASARAAGCAESTAHLWERREDVVAEIAALRGAVAGPVGSEATGDLETILRRSIAQSERRGDHRAIATLVDKLRLVLDSKRTSGLVDQLRAASPDEVVDALERCVADPLTWSRIGEAAYKRSTFGAMGLEWIDGLALALGGVWLHASHREKWHDEAAPLLAMAGALARHPTVPGLSSTARAEVRQAIADVRAGLNVLEMHYDPSTGTADVQAAPES